MCAERYRAMAGPCAPRPMAHGYPGTRSCRTCPTRALARLDGVRRYLELDEAVAGDLREGRRCDDAAPDREPRLVDRDEDDEPRVLRRHDADERCDVAGGGVAAPLRLRRG